MSDRFVTRFTVHFRNPNLLLDKDAVSPLDSTYLDIKKTSTPKSYLESEAIQGNRELEQFLTARFADVSTIQGTLFD